jgi:hypothetical protein
LTTDTVAEKTSEQSASKKERIAVDKKSTHTQSWKTVPDLMTPRDVKNADGKMLSQLDVVKISNGFIYYLLGIYIGMLEAIL